MLSDDIAYAAARELLRHREHPRRLRANVLVRSWVEQRLTMPVDDGTLRRCLERDLREAIAGLPPRRSQILTRCDLEGESQRAIMRALGLSERHFYRERKAAILELARKLLLTVSATPVQVEPDRFALHLARVDALERAGRTHDALGILSSIRGAVEREDAVRIEVRLTEVNRDAGRFSVAMEHAQRARVAAATVPDDFEAELEAVAGTVAWQSGATACLADGPERSVERLRDRARRGARTLVPHALPGALEMCAEAALESGDAPRALALFEEARASLSRNTEPRSDVLVRSSVWIASARSWVDGGLAASAREFETAYATACAQSLPREASLALGRWCQILDLVGNTTRALALATTQLAPIATDLVGDWRAGAHLDIASTLTSGGQFGAASWHIRQARLAAPGGSFARAAALMQESEVHLAERNAPLAIARAGAAIAEMKRLGRPRHIGAALAVRAEALWLAARPREAALEMNQALELMTKYAHPLRLAAEYRRSARVTRNRAHTRLARELWHAHAVRL